MLLRMVVSVISTRLGSLEEKLLLTLVTLTPMNDNQSVRGIVHVSMRF